MNYWDRLGWRDRLSTPAFTQREYAYSAAWGASSVYTPCFVRDGQEYHPKSGSPDLEAAQPGPLTLDEKEGQVTLTFRPSRPHAHLVAHAAQLAGGISDHVKAGENAGATLTHDFVVVALADAAMTPAPDGTVKATFSLPPPLVANAPKQAVAAWVTESDSLTPLQAIGGDQ